MVREILEKDREEYIEMVTEFYSGDAVMHSIPRSFIERSFDRFLADNRHGGALFIVDEAGETVGYSVYARTWSQEGGGFVIWFEELFIKEEFRGKGYGKEAFSYVFENFPAARYRLEVEPENERAVKLYEKLGFEFMPYRQMVKEIAFKKEEK